MIDLLDIIDLAKKGSFSPIKMNNQTLRGKMFKKIMVQI